MLIALALIALYLVPGFGVAAIFTGRTRWNPLLWLWGSFVIVPIAFTDLGALGLRSTNPVFVVAAAFAIAAAGEMAGVWLRRHGGELRIPRLGPGRRGVAFAVALLLGFAFIAAACATRWPLFAERLPSVADNFAQISEATSVAVTGVPPRHYYFPQIPLSFYYYDFVLPGLLARLSHSHLSVAQCLAVHFSIEAFLVVLTVVGLAFQLCRRPWAACALVFFLTWGGGLDFWVAWATGNLGSEHLEWWTFWAGLQQSIFQISLPITLSVWVPHHWLAGYSVLLGLALIAVVKGAGRTRTVLLGILFAFVAGCSVFVALGLGAGLIFWYALRLRRWGARWGFRDALIELSVAALLSAPLLPIYIGKGTFIGVRTGQAQAGRLSLVEAAPAKFAQDAVHGLAGFAGDFLLDAGVTPLLFLIWLGVNRRRVLKSLPAAWIATIGLALPPLLFVFQSAGANDLAMRGIIPAQIAWAVASAWLLSSRWRGRWSIAVLALACIGSLAAFPSSVYEASKDVNAALEAGEAPTFVRWINRYTPIDAPVVIFNETELHKTSRHMIERLRLVRPSYAGRLRAEDWQYLQFSRLAIVPGVQWDREDPLNLCRQVAAVLHRSEADDVYILDKAPPRSRALPGYKLPVEFGTPVFREPKRAIYRIDCRGLSKAP